MKSLQLAAVILLMAFARIDGQDVEIRPNCGQRLVKRTELMTHSSQSYEHWPWHAAIFHHVYTPSPVYQCGGTVINAQSILTAGHCVSEYNAPMETKQVSVSLGRLNLGVNESSAQNFKVISILTC